MNSVNYRIYFIFVKIRIKYFKRSDIGLIENTYNEKYNYSEIFWYHRSVL